MIARRENNPARDRLHDQQSGAYIESANPDWVTLVKIALAAVSLIGYGSGAKQAVEILRSGLSRYQKAGALLRTAVNTFGDEILTQIGEAVSKE